MENELKWEDKRWKMENSLKTVREETGNQITNEYKEQAEKMYKRIGNEEMIIVEATELEYEDKTAKCGKLTAEIRNIYVENYKKTTPNKIRTKEANLEVTKRWKDGQIH